jgi:hypothetical protein
VVCYSNPYRLISIEANEKEIIQSDKAMFTANHPEHYAVLLCYCAGTAVFTKMADYDARKNLYNYRLAGWFARLIRFTNWSISCPAGLNEWQEGTITQYVLVYPLVGASIVAHQHFIPEG